MAVSCRTLIKMIEKLAPPRLAEKWDNVGFLIGNPEGEATGVLVALELTPGVVEEAVAVQANFILVHHPPIFHPFKSLTTAEPEGRLLAAALRYNLHVYAAHTNLDKVWGGVSDQLARVLGLTDLQPLASPEREPQFKLVVFVPESHEEQVRQAIGDAGAGFIGNYSHCTFRTAGTGTFLPREGANPYLGQVGRIEEAAEYRLETIVPKSLLAPVIEAMLKAHPYEEVAYDLYPLALEEPVTGGLGRVGQLEKPMPAEQFVALVKERLGLETVKVVAGAGNLIRQVAVCGGSGGSLVRSAAQKGAQVLVTGDVGYHDGQLARDLGLMVIDAGHGPTERVILPWLKNQLEEALAAANEGVPVFVSQVNTDPWCFG